MKDMTRRDALIRLSTAASAVAVGGGAAFAASSPRLTFMGVVTYALGLHQKFHWGGRYAGLCPALALFEECRRLGAAGIMVALTAQDTPHVEELRRRADQHGMYIEASITPPKSADDVARFESDVRTAQTAGAALARTVIMPGRRYEQFKSLAEFRDYQQRGRQSLEWAAPVLARHKFRLAVENHKDERIPEKLETLKKVGSEHIGICVDFGNSVTLLEDPLETVRAFAPYAMTTHIKDQAVRETGTGFLFADVALGQGILDLPAMVSELLKANPKIRFGLEVITRDALDVPVLTPQYWSTMSDVPPADLARTLRLVKTHSARKPFTSISSLSPRKQMRIELQNIQQSIRYARTRLGLK
jgi:sugar phosphate isomerase/epimerase